MIDTFVINYVNVKVAFFTWRFRNASIKKASGTDKGSY